MVAVATKPLADQPSSASAEKAMLAASLVPLQFTFVEVDPARDSWFACWDPASPGGLLESATDDGPRSDLLVHTPAKRGTTKTTVSARRLDLADAIDLLAMLGRRDPASASAHAWADVIRAALSFIADGRVLPWVSPAGYDTWRVDPLGPSQTALVGQLAAALPAQAHATPVEVDDQRGLISDPTYAVRAACDAVADRFLRTPAAHRVGSLRLYADPGQTKAQHLRPWVKDLAAAHCASSRLALRVHPPADEDEPWTVRFQLVSVVDPSLVVDAADYWHAPAEVMARLGNQAEVTLLAGLRTLGRLVPPFESVLDQVAPTEARLREADLDLLLDSLEELAEHKIDVRWPANLVAPRIERRVVASTGEAESSSAPSGALTSVMDLKGLLSVDWEFLLDGVALTAEELQVVGEAKRAVVPLRGKWVRLDRADRERLKARPPNLSMGDILAAALSGDTFGEGDASGDLLTIDAPTSPGSADDTGDEPERVELRIEGNLATLIDNLAQVTGGREESEPLGLQAELRPYQRRGLAWMADLCSLGLGGCLADDMGLGKTIQVLALHALRHQPGAGGTEHTEPGPTLVVCPTSLLTNWAREAQRFVPDVAVRIYHGPNRNLDGIKPDELVITSYGVVRGDAERLAETRFGLIVADEAQQAKNPRSSTARALRKLNGTNRLALTGTPVENRLSELWSIFDWAVPGLLGPLATFRRTTAVPIERDGDEAATHRLSRLLAPFMLRRRKSDPGLVEDLPDKIERDVIVALSAEQATLYKATVAEALEDLAEAEGMQRRGMVLALLTKLKQVTDHPALFLGETRQSSDEETVADERLAAGRSGKLDALDEILTTAKAGAESSLVFTQYVGMGRLLVEHLTTAGTTAEMLHGGLSTKARQDLVDRFQARELDVLVLSLKAGGTGLNLTAATNVVHFDRWWNPAVEDQATDRAYRIGQDQPVTVHRLITQGTVEDRVAELLKQKRALADRVIGGTGEAWISELDNDELAELVVLETNEPEGQG